MKLQAILSSLVLAPAATSKIVNDFQAFKNRITERTSAPVKSTGTTVHNLKVWSPFFEELSTGSKPFEARKNDRNFKVGDTLRLLEFNPKTQLHTGRALFATVSYILEGGQFGLKKGFVVMGLKFLKNEFISEDAEYFKERYEEKRDQTERLIKINRVLMQQLTVNTAESLGVGMISIMEINKTLGTDLPINNRN